MGKEMSIKETNMHPIDENANRPELDAAHIETKITENYANQKGNEIKNKCCCHPGSIFDCCNDDCADAYPFGCCDI